MLKMARPSFFHMGKIFKNPLRVRMIHKNFIKILPELKRKTSIITADSSVKNAPPK